MIQRYRYRAARSDGSISRGAVEAGTAAQAGALLLARGLHPVALEAADLGETGRRAASRRELAVVFCSLAALVTAGVPLDRAVASTEALARGPLKDCLAACRGQLQEGRTLAQALEAGQGIMPAVVTGVIRAGEHAGRLGPALEQVARQLEQDADLAGRLRQALAYPLLLLVAGVASVLVIGGVVVPRFAGLLADLDQELPPATRLLLGLSSVMTHQGPVILIGIVVAAGLFVTWIRRPEGELRWHAWLLGAPGVGPLRQGLATARVSRALGAALQAGTPLLPALALAADAAGDRAIVARMARARERVTQGESLTAALEREEAVSPGALQLLAVGEQSGQLGAMAGRAGDLAAQEAQRRLSTLVGLLEPALVIALGGLVAFTAAALLQALYSIRPGA